MQLFERTPTLLVILFALVVLLGCIALAYRAEATPPPDQRSPMCDSPPDFMCPTAAGEWAREHHCW